jgi:hypothetical protein
LKNIFIINLKFYLDKNSLNHLFKNQISSLFINLNYENNSPPKGVISSIIFKNILARFTNLRCLKFSPSVCFLEFLPFDFTPITDICSTLLELHVNVTDMDGCLLILDGRFDQLRILYITVYEIYRWYPHVKLKVGYSYLYLVYLNELTFVLFSAEAITKFTDFFFVLQSEDKCF